MCNLKAGDRVRFARVGDISPHSRDFRIATAPGAVYTVQKVRGALSNQIFFVTLVEHPNMEWFAHRFERVESPAAGCSVGDSASPQRETTAMNIPFSLLPCRVVRNADGKITEHKPLLENPVVIVSDDQIKAANILRTQMIREHKDIPTLSDVSVFQPNGGQVA